MDNPRQALRSCLLPVPTHDLTPFLGVLSAPCSYLFSYTFRANKTLILPCVAKRAELCITDPAYLDDFYVFVEVSHSSIFCLFTTLSRFQQGNVFIFFFPFVYYFRESV